jgi:spore coat protein CotH
MIEPIDDEFVERRVEGMFENDGGFLWKCVYGEGGPADLRSTEDWKFNWDQDNGINYTYEFKGDEEDFAAAKEQLVDFILKLKGKGEDSFYKWINEVCDVNFLLKTYAVNVAVGMWDDHWNNGNNYYLYFNSTDKYDYKVFFLPYDYDNTLGTSSVCGAQSDAGRQDPYDWGDSGNLMERLMKFDDFKLMYRKALGELVDPANKLLDMDSSVERIKGWQDSIDEFVSNDTGEDMSIHDRPAYWSNHGEYRLMDKGSNNFFRVKTETIRKMK